MLTSELRLETVSEPSSSSVSPSLKPDLVGDQAFVCRARCSFKLLRLVTDPGSVVVVELRMCVDPDFGESKVAEGGDATEALRCLWVDGVLFVVTDDKSGFSGA